MRKRLILAVATVALLCAGTGTAAVLRTITLNSGQCVKVAQTKVCAAKTKTVTVTATPTPAPTKLVLDFSGSGNLTMAPFTTTVGETLTWTWQNTNGAFPTGMHIHDDSQHQFVVSSYGTATSGSTYLAPGLHTFQTVTAGNWTIHIS